MNVTAIENTIHTLADTQNDGCFTYVCLKWKEMPFIAKWVQIENVQTVKYCHGQDVIRKRLHAVP